MFLDADALTDLQPLAASWRAVREEMRALARGSFAPWPERELYDSERWTVFGLYAFGTPLAGNCRLCPRTTELVASLPGLVTAGFSRLAPGAHIRPHTGYYPAGTMTRCHLGLEVPDGCALRVGGETRGWREGTWLVFDDASEHEAWNAGDRVRTVLLLDLVPAGVAPPVSRLTAEAREFLALQRFLDRLGADEPETAG